jgi:hypothetical protein
MKAVNLPAAMVLLQLSQQAATAPLPVVAMAPLPVAATAPLPVVATALLPVVAMAPHHHQVAMARLHHQVVVMVLPHQGLLVAMVLLRQVQVGMVLLPRPQAVTVPLRQGQVDMEPPLQNLAAMALLHHQVAMVLLQDGKRHFD